MLVLNQVIGSDNNESNKVKDLQFQEKINTLLNQRLELTECLQNAEKELSEKERIIEKNNSRFEELEEDNK